MFEKLKKWLSGTFVCTKCGNTYQFYTLGFGTCICPKCYDGEKKFIFFDESYWPNRWLIRKKGSN